MDRPMTSTQKSARIAELESERDNLLVLIKRRCSCEFIDGICIEPCKYHGELEGGK
jgi:hypothetical protein